MLVIVSDLHLTDGTTGSSLPGGCFHLFADRLRELAVAASHRADGSYRPIEQLDLLLLGDVLDLVRSHRWLEAAARPWHDPHSPEVFNTIARVTSDVLRNNDPGLQALRDLAGEAPLCIPPADRRSGSLAHQASAGQPVNVRIHYMVGNHDWMLHLPGQHYDRLRQTVVQRLGLSQRADYPFPHDPSESESLLEVLRRHRVLARHGDIFDPLNFEEDRNLASLGDALAIELLARFTSEIATTMADDLPEATLAGLEELDNIRPTLLAPIWIDGLLERTCPVPAVRKRVKLTWDRLADRLLQLDFVRSRENWSPVDLVDGLNRVLKFGKRLSLGWTSSVVNWLHGLRGMADDSYCQHAMAEQDFRNRRARHIVYGHTHHAESVPLDASYAENYVLNQMYFNAGTWRRVHRPTHWAPAEHEFIPADCMTFLAFYHDDERGGRPYETWSGTLAIPARGPRMLRLDASHARAAGAVPVPHTIWQPAAAGMPAASPWSNQAVDAKQDASA